jgi:hypothetical protein
MTSGLPFRNDVFSLHAAIRSKSRKAHRKNFMKLSVSISDDLVAYLDSQVTNRSQLIEGLLQQWSKEKQNQEMVQACLLSDELTAEEWQAWETAEL